MSRRASRRPRAGPVEGPPATAPESEPGLPAWTIHLVALATLVLAAALAWASRGNLNVDGVAYLDLAERVATGELGVLLQGYWSPAYPFLLGVTLALTGAAGHAAAVGAHAVNFLIAAAGIVLLWRAGWQRRDAPWTLLALTALLTASARTLRLDAVTPDLLLLLTLLGLTLELLRHDGPRPLRLGSWAVAAFLAKTSAWPWLLLALAVALLAAWRDPSRRRAWLLAMAIAVAPMLCWTAALSLREGHLTIGSAGRLNACWYITQCDGRSPDTHDGGHDAYHDWRLGAGATARVAIYSDARQTYAPWSDPTAWQEGIESQQRHVPTPLQYLTYAAIQLGWVFREWVTLLLALVVIPTWLVTRRAPSVRSIVTRPPGIAILLGGVGVMQFVAVHAEPRLIAPFVLMAALGFLAWRGEGRPTRARELVAVVGFAIALVIGTWHLRDQLLVTASTATRVVRLERTYPPERARHRVAVIGEALPLMPDLYRARATVVAQVIAPDTAAMRGWSAEARGALAGRLRELGATSVWIWRGNDGYTIGQLGR